MDAQMYLTRAREINAQRSRHGLPSLGGHTEFATMLEAHLKHQLPSLHEHLTKARALTAALIVGESDFLTRRELLQEQGTDVSTAISLATDEALSLFPPEEASEEQEANLSDREQTQEAETQVADQYGRWLQSRPPRQNRPAANPSLHQQFEDSRKKRGGR